MYDRRLDSDLEEEQYRRDEMRARSRSGPLAAIGGFLSGLLWMALIAVLVIVLLVWIF